MGQGTLKIGDEAGFGFPISPMMGNGVLLMRPHSPESEIAIGRKTWINDNTTILAVKTIKIGGNCLIGDLVMILMATS
jgi:acetyltransferase-like isoleucine patch superfamily enzyme